VSISHLILLGKKNNHWNSLYAQKEL